MDNELYMKQALRLARKGAGSVSPNPLVGAVITKNGAVIGTGFHKDYGGGHAEMTALRIAGNAAKGATLYCNLEPCSHWGKTPPCTDSIMSAGIRKVVIGMKDPNPLVNGKGIQKLKKNGVDVEVGICQEECESVNVFYKKFITTGLPYVTLKMAQSLDGRITKNSNERMQISSEKAQRFVHKLRAEYDAVIIGKHTALVDNPLLTTRLVSGRTPKRIVLDTHLECDLSLKLFRTIELGKVYVATASDNASRIRRFEENGIDIMRIGKNASGSIHLPQLVKKFGELDIASVLVEGGAELNSSFLRERLADRIIFIIAPLIYGEGVNVFNFFSSNGSIVELQDVSRKQLGKDIIVTGHPVYTTI